MALKQADVMAHNDPEVIKAWPELKKAQGEMADRKKRLDQYMKAGNDALTAKHYRQRRRRRSLPQVLWLRTTPQSRPLAVHPSHQMNDAVHKLWIRKARRGWRNCSGPSTCKNN